MDSDKGAPNHTRESKVSGDIAFLSDDCFSGGGELNVVITDRTSSVFSDYSRHRALVNAQCVTDSLLIVASCKLSKSCQNLLCGQAIRSSCWPQQPIFQKVDQHVNRYLALISISDILTCSWTMLPTVSVNYDSRHFQSNI